MADIRQTSIDAEQICKATEQKFAAGTALTGVIPTLSTQPVGERDFVPFYGTADGITRMKNPGPTAPEATLDEADAGGKFVFANTQPAVLEQVLAFLGTVSVAWTVNIITSAGTYQVASGTGTTIMIIPKVDIMPGESVTVTCATPTGKPWARVYIRSDQARH